MMDMLDIVIIVVGNMLLFYISMIIGDKIFDKRPEKRVEITESQQIIEMGVKALYEASDGNIMLISLRPESKGVVDIILSDEWSNTSYENKKMFVDEVVSIIERTLIMAGKKEEDEVVKIYFFNSRNELLAKPSVYDGYEVEM